MIIELKYLTPYLPYSVTFYVNKRIYVLTSDVIARREANRKLKNIKLILHPLIDLEKEILKCPEGEFIVDGERIREWYDLDPTRCNYEQMTYLFENYYDVFGLIKAGLAIDINTL